jgi:hypothetical protein
VKAQSLSRAPERMCKTRIISKAIASLFLAAVAVSCSGLQSIPITTQEDQVMSAFSDTQTPIPTAMPVLPTSTLPITLTPTVIPPGAYSNTYAPPPGKLEHAKSILRKHHALLPYIDDAKELMGLEYYGCSETDDFGGGITYDVIAPIETVNDAFLEYFQKDNWEFVDAIHGIEMGVPSIKYEVYRISTRDNPAFERLEVVLYDYTRFTADGKSQTRVRSNLNHVENRKYFGYIFDFVNYPCKMWYAFNAGW